MGNPIQFTETYENMLNDHGSRIVNLEAYKTQCDELHRIGKDHRKRVDDAMENLTSSNILLAKSITDMNITLSRIADTVDSDRPTIKIMKDVGAAWSVNKKIFAAIVTFAAGCLSIAAFWKMFF